MGRAHIVEQRRSLSLLPMLLWLTFLWRYETTAPYEAGGGTKGMIWQAFARRRRLFVRSWSPAGTGKMGRTHATIQSLP